MKTPAEKAKIVKLNGSLTTKPSHKKQNGWHNEKLTKKKS